jgi:hypothetical protein
MALGLFLLLLLLSLLLLLLLLFRFATPAHLFTYMSDPLYFVARSPLSETKVLRVILKNGDFVIFFSLTFGRFVSVSVARQNTTILLNTPKRKRNSDRHTVCDKGL